MTVVEVRSYSRISGATSMRTAYRETRSYFFDKRGRCCLVLTVFVGMKVADCDALHACIAQNCDFVQHLLTV